MAKRPDAPIASGGSALPIFKEAHFEAFVQRLSELGLVEGRNLSIERRQSNNILEKLPALANDLRTAKALGSKIPDIVMVRATRVVE